MALESLEIWLKHFPIEDYQLFFVGRITILRFCYLGNYKHISFPDGMEISEADIERQIMK